MQIATKYILSIIVLAFFCVGFSVPAYAQNDIKWVDLKNLEIQPHLPKYLLSRKSVVFMQVPQSANNPNVRVDWRALSEQVHQSLRKSKVDAVGYYYLDDILDNSDAMVSFSKEMTKREIKYVIVVEQFAKGVGSYRITVTAFNKKTTFISEGQKAWQAEGPDIKVLLNGLRKEIYRAEMKVENYLVADFPEFFTDTKIILGKRMEVYCKDLKVDKLIVPRFPLYHVEDSSKLDESATQKIQIYNRKIDEKNLRLEEIMKSYPLKYEFSNTSDAKELYNQGHQYVLAMVSGTGKTVKQMLNYKLEANETDFISIKATEIGSVLKTIPVDGVVTKYYVKHVYTKDVYLGSRWEADLTWEEGLENFIFNMKAVLKLKN